MNLTHAQLNDIIFAAAERAVRDATNDPDLRRSIAGHVVDCARTATYGSEDFRHVAGDSNNLDVRQQPSLVDAAMRAVSDKLHELGVTAENFPAR